MDESSPPFSTPEELIERSQPVQRTGWFGLLLSGIVLSMMLSAIAGWRVEGLAGYAWLLASVVVSALFMVVITSGRRAVERQREEQRRLESVEEMVQLRRWAEAAEVVQQLLSRPMRTPAGRVQGLIYLSSIYSRYGRYADALALHDHLLENVVLDPAMTFGLKVARAVAMLHEDHLVDADRAISELRRTDGARESAGLALLELYRDVKTGHADEAIELFNLKLPVLRKQLGQRLADAYGLVAKAFEMVGRDGEGQAAYSSATLLAPIAEVSRRYSEVASLAFKFRPTAAPAE